MLILATVMEFVFFFFFEEKVFREYFNEESSTISTPTRLPYPFPEETFTATCHRFIHL